MGDILSYARVSTGDQDVSAQTMRLEKAGAIKVFTYVTSGKCLEPPALAALTAYARKGATLAVVPPAQIARSTPTAPPARKGYTSTSHYTVDSVTSKNNTRK